MYNVAVSVNSSIP